MWVEFQEKGFNTAVGVMTQFQKRLDETNKSAELLKKALDSGAYAKVSQQVAAANAQLDQLNARARQIDLEARFGKIGAMAILAKEKSGQLFDVIRQGVALVAGPAAIGFGILTGTIMGFVRAGLDGSVQGYRLNLMFSMLSKEIAGVFLPVVERVTDWIQSAVGWFQRLTGQQQAMLRVTTLVAAGVLGVTVAVGGLIIAGIGLTSTILSMAAAMTALDITLAGIPILIGVVVTGLAAIGVGTTAAAGGLYVMGQRGASIMEKLQNAAQGLWDKMKPIIEIGMSWARIFGSIYDIANRLREAVVSPFTRLIDRLTAGQSLLNLWADILDRVANAIEDLIVPFAAVAQFIENRVNNQLQAMNDLLDAAGVSAQKLLGWLAKVSPLAAAGKYFFENTRASDKNAGDHQKPAPADAGFESAESTWKRIAAAVSKIGAAAGGEAPDERAAKAAEDTNRIVGELEKKWDGFNKDFVEPIGEIIKAAGSGPGGLAVRLLAGLR
jgi:hypothetical protein